MSIHRIDLTDHTLKWLQAVYPYTDPNDVVIPEELPKPSSLIYFTLVAYFISEISDRLKREATDRDLLDACFAIWKHYVLDDSLPEYLDPCS